MVIDLSDTSDLEILNTSINNPLISRTNNIQDDIDIIEISITDDSSDNERQADKFSGNETNNSFLSDQERTNTPASKRKLKNVNNNQSELLLKSPQENIIKLNEQDKEKLFLHSDQEEQNSSDDFGKAMFGKRNNHVELGDQNEIDKPLKKQKTSSSNNIGIDLSHDDDFGNKFDSRASKQKEINYDDIVVLELSDSSDEDIVPKMENALSNNKYQISPIVNNLNKAENLVDNIIDDTSDKDGMLSLGNQTENSVMLKVQEIISDLDEIDEQPTHNNFELPSGNIETNNDRSNWEIKPHVDYLATIQISATDLDLQLKEIHKNKMAKQRYTQSNKVSRIFKQDIVEKELLMISNMDLTMKNNQQDCFYIQNGDLLIKKREEEFLKKDIKDLVKMIPDLKYATFTRRLTSVYELNSEIFLPIFDLLKIGNNLTNNNKKIDFVDVDMSESLFLINIQRLYEIFHFKEYRNVKARFESYLLKNKKITLVLTSFNKFKAKLIKWENSKQMEQFQNIHQTIETTSKKPKRKLIPEEYLNCSINDVNEFILRLQMTYPTHLHCQIIETEITFINDWMLNYLKTILRRRYVEKKENLILKSKLVTSNPKPFDNFLLGLSGITQNNIQQISATLGGSYQNLERNIESMYGMNQYKGTEKKIINLLYKFIKSKHKDELL